MLATQLNKMVTDSTLDEFCVIKVKRLQCNTMQGKKVIIILDMEVLRPGSQVNHLLKLFMDTTRNASRIVLGNSMNFFSWYEMHAV